MPYVQLVTWYPVLNSVREFRGLIEGRVKAQQAAGIDASLTRTVFAPETSAFTIRRRYPTLADFESARDRQTQANQTTVDRMSAMQRQAGTNAIHEVLQRTTVPRLVAKWTRVVIAAPALGRGPELRALLLEQGQHYEAQGQGRGLLVEVAGPESGSFRSVFGNSSLAELEQWRAGPALGQSQQDYVQRVNALVSRPLQSSIHEVLIPYLTS